MNEHKLDDISAEIMVQAMSFGPQPTKDNLFPEWTNQQVMVALAFAIAAASPPKKPWER